MQGVRRIRVTREKIKEDESGQPLSPVARFCHERRNNLYTIAIIGFDTKINPDVIKANIRFMLKHPRFSSLQVTDDNGVMRWVPTKAVDINNHILAPEVNESPDDNFVGNYISNLTKSTINNSMPMWDFHILNIKTSDAESIAIFRVHHSIGDGLSLMSILLSSSLHQNSAPEALEPVNRARKNVPKHNSRMSELFVKFLSFFIVAWNTMVDMVSYISTPWSSPDTQTPLKGTSSRFHRSYGRRIAYRLVQLDDIKLIKNVMGVTVNDVVVGVIQGGMSRYLNNKYVDDDVIPNPSELLDNIVESLNLARNAAIAEQLTKKVGDQRSTLSSHVKLA
ncbi:hypothetical protein ACFE04_016236 [Oxalis oulophora]